MRLPPAIFLIGPTASGKTAAALALAHSLQPQGGAEIISVELTKWTRLVKETGIQ